MGSSWSRWSNSVTIHKENDKTFLKWPQRFSAQDKHLLLLSGAIKIDENNGYDRYEIQEKDIPFYDAVVECNPERTGWTSGFQQPRSFNKCGIYFLVYETLPLWILAQNRNQKFETMLWEYLNMKRILKRGDYLNYQLHSLIKHYIFGRDSLIEIPEPTSGFLYPNEFSIPEYPLHYWNDPVNADYKLIHIEPEKYHVLEIEELKSHKLGRQHTMIDGKNSHSKLIDARRFGILRKTEPILFYDLYADFELKLCIYTDSGKKTTHQIYKAFLLVNSVVLFNVEKQLNLCVSYDSVVMNPKNYSTYTEKQKPRLDQLLNSNILIHDILRIVCEYDHIVF
jgi:hypothetical protein